MENLKKIRKENHLTQADVAKVLNITTSAYGNYELNQRSPTPEQLVQLADYYGTSVDYLLGREPTALQINNSQFVTNYGHLFNDDYFKRYVKIYDLLNKEQRIYLLGYVIGVTEKFGIKIEDIG